MFSIQNTDIIQDMNAILIVDPKVPVRMDVSVNRLSLFVLPVLNLSKVYPACWPMPPEMGSIPFQPFS